MTSYPNVLITSSSILYQYSRVVLLSFLLSSPFSLVTFRLPNPVSLSLAVPSFEIPTPFFGSITVLGCSFLNRYSFFPLSVQAQFLPIIFFTFFERRRRKKKEYILEKIEVKRETYTRIKLRKS